VFGALKCSLKGVIVLSDPKNLRAKPRDKSSRHGHRTTRSYVTCTVGVALIYFELLQLVTS